MILGTFLMLSFYARKRSQLRVGWLRWGFLVIGAAAFADGFATWWTARTDRDAIPFGENEGRGLSDPTVLVFEQGFSIPGLVSSYVWAGVACLAVLAVAYALGLRKEPEPDDKGEA
jgi:bacteriorhodopsin